jgi:hypothetical protein
MVSDYDDDDDDDDDTVILRNVGGHLKLLLRYILEDLGSLATPLREPGILRNLAALRFEVVRDTMADETGYWLLSRGSRKSHPWIC